MTKSVNQTAIAGLSGFVGGVIGSHFHNGDKTTDFKVNKSQKTSEPISPFADKTPDFKAKKSSKRFKKSKKADESDNENNK